jgi:glutamyl-tRNA reductase
MAVMEPWSMAITAEVAGAEERRLLAELIERLAADHPDWVLLSTCHRVELYGFGDAPQLDRELLLTVGEAAVARLARVAAGLESAVIGEDEVLHQVREALRLARSARPLDGRLQRLFETAIAAGRRARAGRTASSGGLAQRAVAWLQQRSALAGRPVVVAGAGRMGSALAHAAANAGAELTIASRDAGKAQRLARVYGGRGVELGDGADLAPRSAGVAVALAGVWHQFQPMGDDLPPIADISAPSAVPAVVRARLNGGFLGIDDLFTVARPVPRGYIEEAEQVVRASSREYVRWLQARGSGPGPSRRRQQPRTGA